jgi:hypothetical protein
VTFEKFVGDWRGNTFNERVPLRWIISHHLHSALFHRGRWLPPLTGKSRAARRLVFVDDVLRHLIEDRIPLCLRLACTEARHGGYRHKSPQEIFVHLIFPRDRCRANKQAFDKNSPIHLFRLPSNAL